MSFEVLGFNFFFFLWLYKYGGVVLSVGQTILVVVCPVSEQLLVLGID